MTCDTSLQGIDNNNEWGQYEKKNHQQYCRASSYFTQSSPSSYFESSETFLYFYSVSGL